MIRSTIASCLIENKVYKIGEYVTLNSCCDTKTVSDINDIKWFKDKELKILNLYCIKRQKDKEPDFMAIVEAENGKCLDVKVSSLMKNKTDNIKSKFTIMEGNFNFKAYETLSGEVKFFI